MTKLSVPKVHKPCGQPILTTEELDRHDLFCQGYEHAYDSTDPDFTGWLDSHYVDQELRKRESPAPLAGTEAGSAAADDARPPQGTVRTVAGDSHRQNVRRIK